ncbi:hypothetical protein M5K25_004959 [Dendrobium thyrsiflorum]|uniref:RRM domain-containing protein n=1 Tax=Dendrobium thyrsiflorum TaxID=117978 RepID=A0ABD0VHM2_DENTH
MDDHNLTVQVLNISPATTREDLTMFFSYCGTIDKIQLKKDNDSSQSAFVTFRQPYAVRTSLLLNDALIGDRHVKIIRPPKLTNIPVIFGSSKDHERSGGGFIPTCQSALQTVTLRGQETLNKAKETARYTGKTVVNQANSAILAVEQRAGGIGSAIMSSNCFSNGTLWLSGMLDRASKSVAELGGSKAQNSNFSKKK